MTLVLLAAQAAFAMGSIRTELDRKAARIGDEFTLAFLLPADCGYADVPLPQSAAYEVVSKDYGQGAQSLSKITVEDQGGDQVSVRRGFARSQGRIVYVLRALSAGTISFAPIRVQCGATVTETFRREIKIVASGVQAPPPQARAEDDLAMTPAIQQLVPNAPSELQLLDKELGALRRSTTALTDLAYNEAPETDRSILGRLSAYYRAWQARVAAAKKIWTLEAFGVSPDAAPWVAGGAFVAAALGVVLFDFWKRFSRRRADRAKLPEIEIRRPPLPRRPEGPKTDPPENS